MSLHSASWLTTEGNYQAEIHRGKILIVPTVLQPQLPKTRFQRWWQGITNAPRIDEWLEEHRYLIAQCRLLENKKIDLSAGEAAIQEQLQEYREIRNTLTQKINELKAQKPDDFWKFFRPSQYNRITACESFLTSQRGLIIRESLDAFERQLSSVESIAKFGGKDFYPLQRPEFFEYIYQELNSLKRQGMMESEQEERMSALEARHQILLPILNPSEQKIKQTLRELERGNVFEFSSTLFAFIDDLETNTLIPAKNACLEKFKRSIAYVIEKKDVPLSEQEKDVLWRSFCYALKLITRISSDTIDREELEQGVLLLYGEYLKCLSQNSEHSEWLVLSERILPRLFEKMGNEALTAQVTRLQKARAENSPSFSEEAATLYNQYCIEQSGKQCRVFIDSLCNKLLEGIKAHRSVRNNDPLIQKGVMARIQSLIDSAETREFSSLHLLPGSVLKPSDCRTLGIPLEKREARTDPSTEPLRSCNEILELRSLKKQTAHLDKDLLEQLVGELQRELNTNPPRLNWVDLKMTFFQNAPAGSNSERESNDSMRAVIALGA